MAVYYNDNDQFCAEWLRNLIRAGLLPAGDVDDRDIREVSPDDLRGYTQAHFFAGIGGWPYALRLAGWPDDAPVWTGSCPCQPFSVAEQRQEANDERRLWPVWRKLISECRPATIFGEQVARPLGRKWLAGVRLDLEALGYAIGAADLPAASVGAPHIRQRLWWVADATIEQVGRARQSWEYTMPARGSYWAAFDVVVCGDDRLRRVEPGTFPLANGVPARMGRVRAYGNAVVPQVAAVFVTAFLEVR